MPLLVLGLFADGEGMWVLKHLRSRVLKPHNSRQQVGGLDTGSIGDKATVVTAFISPAAEHLAEKLEPRSEEHTSKLQSPKELVCRLLLEKKKKMIANKLFAQGSSGMHPDGGPELTP